MTAQPDVDARSPWVSDDAVADLEAESVYLARTLGQPQITTAGAAGILNAASPSTAWIYNEIDADAFLAEVGNHHPHPEVMVPLSAVWVAHALRRRGWHSTQTVDRLRRDLSQVEAPAPRRTLRPDLAVRIAHRDDLPGIRALHVESFGTEDSADYLPESVLDVRDLQLFVAVSPADSQALIGVSGVRLRHHGALVFGLATRAEHRRRGVATAVVDQCLDWATERGVPFALADVDLPAPSFWAQLGFCSTSRWLRFTQTEQPE